MTESFVRRSSPPYTGLHGISARPESVARARRNTARARRDKALAKKLDDLLAPLDADLDYEPVDYNEANDWELSP